MSASYKSSHLDKGETYHQNFSSQPRRSLIWTLEQEMILRVIDQYFGARPIRHLDFACGTGRIARLIRPKSLSTKGVDVSTSMLAVAKKENPEVEFITGDIVADTNLLAGEQFDLITAFRFFPNAEHELRVAVLNRLKTVLAKDGILLFNNHRNSDCTRSRLVRTLTFGTKGNAGWGERDVSEFVESAGYELVQAIHIGHIPEWEKLCWVQPRQVALWLERRMVGHQGILRGENVLYVCRSSSA
jgi:SAM-dependent methyltransferase